MTSRRIAKVAQAMRETISSCILRGLKDPRVRDVTVLNVDVSEDTRTAKVYVSVMGDERAQALCLHGLNSARGYLQRKVADRVQTRYTPVLTFVLDSSVKRSVATSRILREIAAENAVHDGTGLTEAEAGPEETDDAAVDDAAVDEVADSAGASPRPKLSAEAEPAGDPQAENGPRAADGSPADTAEIEATPEDSS
ncbi:MAG: 30S ribosome-binding factor RbfA [Planctomycetaceae bacterium]|nr:30S ribosome-binding factor RbfA [Planctomycetaceae bacterium]